ncbi:lectin-like isoform X1 [Argentina anserina]|uniref:lectin-like isoform X1 n=1 Tax=Argentina anserina TaxID=57926 RepID=UPI0021765F9B|nr:lectin-like isoform X1 [Potentilla anserina]
MGTGWSQDEASQSQQQSPAQPSNNAAVEKVAEAMPSGPKPMAKVEKAASFQAKPSADHNQGTKVVKEVTGILASPVVQVKQQQPQKQLPHNFEAIVKDADTPINKSPEHLFGHLYAGILLNQKRKKYWVDKKSNNCFMVYPRDLKITWAEDNRYWRWPSLEETSNVFIDAAELLNVCWLEVHGKIDSTKLSPGTLYEVVFIVMLKAAANNWKVPVNVRLTLPDGNKQGRKAELNKIPREQWTEIPIGEFKASPGLSGNIEFSMYEYDDGKWKSGLLIRGVAIRPKN